MISSCGIYSIKFDGAFCAPFVALNANQAVQIVKEALDGYTHDGVLYCLGELDFVKGIVSNDLEEVVALSEISVNGIFGDMPEIESNDVPPHVFEEANKTGNFISGLEDEEVESNDL